MNHGIIRTAVCRNTLGENCGFVAENSLVLRSRVILPATWNYSMADGNFVACLTFVERKSFIEESRFYVKGSSWGLTADLQRAGTRVIRRGASSQLPHTLRFWPSSHLTSVSGASQVQTSERVAFLKEELLPRSQAVPRHEALPQRGRSTMTRVGCVLTLVHVFRKLSKQNDGHIKDVLTAFRFCELCTLVLKVIIFGTFLRVNSSCGSLYNC